MTKIITIFGSAFPKEGSVEYATAYELGKLLAQSGYVVCNGGYGGTMEASARGAKEAGGKAIGVVTEVFSTETNKYSDQKIITKTHVERLMKLIELGNAYVVLRGGTGTLVELATVWEYMNKGLLSQKPLIVIGEFWKGVVQTIRDEMKGEGKSDAANYANLVDSPQQSMRMLKELMLR